MTDDSNEHHRTGILRRPMPVWLAAIIVGCFLGGFGTYQVMRAVGYDLPDRTNSEDADVRLEAMRAGMVDTLRRSMMGMGGTASEQQSLTALVGKLDLLSHGLRIELSPEQTEKLALALAKLDLAEQMTSDEAHAHIDAIQDLLTEEQKTALATVDLPRDNLMTGGAMTGGAMTGGAMTGGAMTGGAMTGGAMTGGAMIRNRMMSSGGAPSDDNPFQQEINQKRLHDFLDRLRDAEVEPPDLMESTP